MRRALVMLLACLFAHSAHALPESITIAADVWCPYNCDPGHQKAGYVVEVAKAIFEPKGIAVYYEVTTWKRALNETRKGHYHAAICATAVEAPGFIFPKSPVGASVFKFFTAPESTWKFTTIKALQSISLGVVEGYDYEGDINEFIWAHKNHRNHLQMVSGNDTALQNIRKLLAGRIDVMLEDENVVMNALLEMGKPESALRSAGVLTPAIDRDKLLYLAFSPKLKESKELAAIFDAGIQRMRKNGEWDAILARYDVKDWQ